jgi:transcriptional regulator with XRE-family HTH domain
MLHRAIKLLRLYNGLSAQEMAEKLNIYPSNLSLCEKGSRKIPVTLIDKYGKIFGMKSSEIINFAEKLKTKKGLETAIFESIKETIRSF